MKAKFGDPLATVNSAFNYALTVTNPCYGTAWVARTISDITVPIMSTATLLVTIKDTASVAGGNFDGSELCGLRTYTYSISPSPDFVVAKASTTYFEDTLTFTPTLTSLQTSYVVSLSACLPYITSCYLQDVTVTV